MGKGEIARHEQFLLFPQRFQKTCTADNINATLTAKVISWPSMTHMYVFSSFLTPVLTQLSFKSHWLLFSHALAEVRGENTPLKKSPQLGIELTTIRSWVRHAHYWAIRAGTVRRGWSLTANVQQNARDLWSLWLSTWGWKDHEERKTLLWGIDFLGWTISRTMMIASLNFGLMYVIKEYLVC